MRPPLFAFLLLALASPARAETPARLHLTGRLTTVGSEPISATLPMTFRLYAESDGGAALWTEPHAEVDVLDGRFDVVLGGSVDLEPAWLDRPTPLYAGITVDEDGDAGVEVRPRTPVGGVAWALRVPVADAAETLSDPSELTAAVGARLLAEHAAEVRGAEGAPGDPGGAGADGADCYEVVGDRDGAPGLSPADCRGLPGAPGDPGGAGAPGASCWEALPDGGGADPTPALCLGPPGPRGAPDVTEGLLYSAAPERHERRGEPLVPFEDFGAATDSVQVEASGAVRSVRLWLDYRHPDLTEVQMMLSSPQPGGVQVGLHARGEGQQLLGWAGEGGFEPVEPLGTPRHVRPPFPSG